MAALFGGEGGGRQSSLLGTERLVYMKRFLYPKSKKENKKDKGLGHVHLFIPFNLWSFFFC